MRFNSRAHAGFWHAFWIGSMLAHIALLLHPMDPFEFLAQQVSDPLASMLASYGVAAAVLFWFGASGIAIGMAGMLAYTVKWSRRAIRRNGKAAFSVPA